MAGVTAADVKALREKTGLPMMDCKRALQETEGDLDKAIETLRKAGAKTMEKRAGRETSAGRIAIHIDTAAGVNTMIELCCESAPVATNDDFVQLANDLATQLATGPGAETPEELLSQTSPSNTSITLKEQFDDLTNRIREVFRLRRIVRVDGTCGGYVHHNGAVGVLLGVEGDGQEELARGICMHVAAIRPQALSKEELDETVVAKEREILSEQARQEGKPEKIIEKMVEGRMRNFFAEQCLLEQPYVKADDGKTVGETAKQAGMKILRYIHWELGKD